MIPMKLMGLGPPGGGIPVVLTNEGQYLDLRELTRDMDRDLPSGRPP